MSNVNKVHAVLPDFTSGEWSTVAQVATATGMGYSTASRYLREAVTAGKAEVTKATTAQGKGNVYRQAANKTGPRGAVKAQGVRPVDAPTDDDVVWVATSRAGVEYHALASVKVTVCGRDTGGRYGRYFTPGGPWATAAEAATAVNGNRPCPKCFPQRADQADESAEIVAARRAKRDAAREVRDDVWAATRRTGLDFHELSGRVAGRTMCGRSTASVTSWTGDREAAMGAGMKPCDRCGTAALEAAVAGPALGEPAESDVQPSEPATLPEAQGEAAPARTGPLDVIVAGLSAARPVSAPPATEERAPRRTRTPRADRGEAQPKAAFAKGELRDAVVNVLRACAASTPDGLTVGDIAKTLNSYPGPVATNLVRMQAAGTVRLTSAEGDKRRYALTPAV